MGGERRPGILGTDGYGVCTLDGGTLIVSRTPTPGVSSDSGVAGLPLEDRFVLVLERTAPLLPGEMQEEFRAMISPTSVAIIAGTLAVWGASHYFGVGFIADAVILVAGVAFLGWQVVSAASDFVSAVDLTVSAKTDGDLHRAAQHLADFIAVVGVAVFMALIFKGGKKVAPRARSAMASAAASRLGGMARAHFEVFRRAASELNRIIIVRNTNPLSTPWIEKGFPPKPMLVKTKTSQTTGIVTISGETVSRGKSLSPGQITEEITKQMNEVKGHGFFVVDQAGIPRNAAGEAMRLPAKPDWPIEPGQVIHPTQKRPLVGDYDLLGVVNPQAPGRNLVLAASDGGAGGGAKTLGNWSSTEITKVQNFVNQRMDQPRVLHGAHEGFKGVPHKAGSGMDPRWGINEGPGVKPDFSDLGESGATAFFPDGKIRQFRDSGEMSAFYKEIGRAPISGSYD